MRKAIAIIVAVLFVFAVTLISFAEEGKKAEPMQAKKPLKKQVTGDVKAIDTKDMTITVTKKMKDKVVETVATVDSNTKIMMDKETRTLSDVKVGDKVTVKYTEVGGKNVAKRIIIKTAKEKTGT